MIELNLEKETINLEYKKASKTRVPKTLWDTVVSFSNTSGGTIVLGVDENQATGEFIPLGLEDAEKTKTNILNTQQAMVIEGLKETSSNDQLALSQKIIFEKNIEIVKKDDKEFLAIYIPKQIHSRPIYIGDDMFEGTYIRVNEGDFKATKDEVLKMLRSSKDDVDKELIPNLQLSDLHLPDVVAFKSEVASITNNSDILDMPTMDFLESIGLASVDYDSSERVLQLNKAALLMFGKFNAITYFFPSFYLDFTVKSNVKNQDYIDRIATGTDVNNIYAFYTRVFSKITAQIHNSFELTEGQYRKENGEQILISVREALVNSLVHADYLSTTPVKISAFPEYITFSNPGEMLIPMEKFAKGGDSEARNPTIFRAFQHAKLGERAATGGPRIFSVARSLQLKNPDVETNLNTTAIQLWTIPDENAFLETLPEEIRPAYSAFLKRPLLKLGDISPMYPTDYQAKKALNQLIDRKLIRKEGRKYLLSANSPEVKKMQVAFMEELYESILKNQMKH